jgi:methyl-accepting chemotaxis protein
VNDKKNFYNAQKMKIQSIVEVSIGIAETLNDDITDGKITKEDAIIRYREILNNMRYDGTNYLFAFDTKGEMIVHPLNPQLNGTKLYDFKDRTGTKIFQLMIEEAEKGGGYVEYFWSKGNDGKLYAKISYAILYKPWNMVVATGVYVE